MHQNQGWLCGSSLASDTYAVESSSNILLKLFFVPQESQRKAFGVSMASFYARHRISKYQDYPAVLE